jgi:hypothetical protein
MIPASLYWMQAPPLTALNVKVVKANSAYASV